MYPAASWQSILRLCRGTSLRACMLGHRVTWKVPIGYTLPEEMLEHFRNFTAKYKIPSLNPASRQSLDEVTTPDAGRCPAKLIYNLRRYIICTPHHHSSLLTPNFSIPKRLFFKCQPLINLYNFTVPSSTIFQKQKRVAFVSARLSCQPPPS